MELTLAGAVAAAAVCVGGGRLAEVTATDEAASHGGDGREAVQESRDGAYRSVGGDCRTRQS